MTAEHHPTSVTSRPASLVSRCTMIMAPSQDQQQDHRGNRNAADNNGENGKFRHRPAEEGILLAAVVAVSSVMEGLAVFFGTDPLGL